MNLPFTPDVNATRREDTLTALRKAASERILIIDGAMGTQIQCLNLGETDFRGERFHDMRLRTARQQRSPHPDPAAGDRGHSLRLRAGRRGHPRDQHLFLDLDRPGRLWHGGSVVYELNRDGARLARRAAVKAEQARRAAALRRRRARADQPHRLAFARRQQSRLPRGHVRRPARSPMPSRSKASSTAAPTSCSSRRFSTRSTPRPRSSPAIEAFAERGLRLPIMISGTITDRSGRTLSGQTPTAFWHSVRHARPFSIGLNCALGASAMREHLAEISAVADTLVCAYPNAGLPNAFGQYDESPEAMAAQIAEFAARRPRQHRRRLLRLDARTTSAPSPRPCAASRRASRRPSRR